MWACGETRLGGNSLTHAASETHQTWCRQPNKKGGPLPDPPPTNLGHDVLSLPVLRNNYLPCEDEAALVTFNFLQDQAAQS